MSEQSKAMSGILEGLIVRVDHVALCVASIDEAAQPWTRLLGTPVIDREHLPVQQVDVGWLALPGQDTRIEFLQPAGNQSVERFVNKRGNAMHHVAISVTDIHEAVARIKAAGLELSDQKPRPGAKGHLVAFLHPRAMAGILVELVQASESAD